MGLRFRLGLFTFGKTGIRLSLFRRGSGVSIPMMGSRSRPAGFGTARLGPFRWYSNLFGRRRKGI